ncbi:MAG: 2-C-methyl-D-erythritol 4-phosphate cytidylyltransferase [Bacteroidetes bacterium]|uniref:2-C-methyl-D-erythritol 4-phosphate cytidylyltransferase n=1 Tax=Daejeonella sp. TaxID=2805397 RepID=UPI00404AAC57|nr:2-C-methyl-D-erythritol 4-phosphate cytidylyltransferase [Bacteroidota bacterium]
MKYYAIIVGAGFGSRMQSEVPKQFMLLNGKPILMHTIEAFHYSDFKPEIIVVLNVDFHTYWEQLCEKYNFSIPHTLIKGGLQRFHSVKNGIKAIRGKSVIAIHDAVRPLASNELICCSFREAEQTGNAVVAIKSKDSVRQQKGNSSLSLNRDEIYLIQTPQTFQFEILNKAYKQEYRNEFTDDASVVERTGITLNLIEGESKNLKITFPEDLTLAEFYLSQTK